MTDLDVGAAQELTEAITSQIQRVLIGQDEIIRQVLVCMVAGGHALIEGVPGLGKTLLVKALAKTFSGKEARIQFTPDLMPSDVTGHAIFNMKQERFEVRRGPVFTNLLLADEINRAPAKTQAALLEVMQERQVTIEGKSFPVELPFMVLATQNPVEQDGTYPLPEAELDRFMFKILVDYPAEDAEVVLVRDQLAPGQSTALDVSQVQQVITPEQILALRQTAAGVLVDEQVLKYAIGLVRSSRETVGISQGGSPRASIALVASARVNAMLDGRDFTTPDDVKSQLFPVLRHRISLSPDREIEGQSTDNVLQELLHNVKAPRL